MLNPNTIDYGITGIYMIYNDLDNRKYIGRSKCIKSRIKYYNKHLGADYVKSKKLNYFVKKYGIKVLNFIIIQVCNESALDFWEPYYIKMYNSINHGFNILDGTQKEIKSGIQYKKCTMKNIDTGETVRADSIKEMSEKINVDKKMIGAVTRKEYNTCHGWYCLENDWRPSYYTVYNNNGEKVQFYSVIKFARDNNISKSKLTEVAHGRKPYISNYYRSYEDYKYYNQNRIKLVDPDGNLVKAKTAKEIELNYGLKKEKVNYLLRGDTFSTKEGWSKG